MRRVHARAWMDFFRLGKRIKSFCHRTSLYHGPMVHWTIAWYERINALQINQLLPRICNTDLAATLGSFKIFPRNCLGLESSPNLFNMVCHRPTSPGIFLQVMQTLQLTKLATQPTVQSSVNPWNFWSSQSKFIVSHMQPMISDQCFFSEANKLISLNYW